MSSKPLIIGLIGLLLSLFSLVLISPQFEYTTSWLARPTYLAVTLMMSAALGYLLVVKLLLMNNQAMASISTFIPILALFLFGLLLRILFLDSTPIFEDDFYRYFFDGALVVEGLNPYLYSPSDGVSVPAVAGAEILGLSNEAKPIHPKLMFLSDQEYMSRVAYPDIRTIYPPLAQLAFAFNSWISPFDLFSWRIILLLVDCVSFVLILMLLDSLGKAKIYSAIYWLNPLLITESINAAHMDVLLVPAIIASALFVVKRHFSWAGIFLGLAVGIKFWPILLAPILFSPWLKQSKLLIQKSLPFIVVTGIMLTPQLFSSLDQTSGLVQYSQNWRTNSFVFGLVEDGLILVDDISIVNIEDPWAMARYVIGFLILAIMFFLIRKSWNNPQALIQSWLTMSAMLFLLSPTGYPWYFIWFLPFLSIIPYWPLLYLTLLLPLYDLRYPLQAMEYSGFFNHIIVVIEFLPVFLLSLYYLYLTYRKLNSRVINSTNN